MTFSTVKDRIVLKISIRDPGSIVRVPRLITTGLVAVPRFHTSLGPRVLSVSEIAST